MDDAASSMRPPPRTPAAVAAELRRRLRADLATARAAAGGELSNDALASAIARAVELALGWHLDAPEHARGPRTSGGWRPAPGPRGRAAPPPEWIEEEGFEPRERPAFAGRRPTGRREPPGGRGGPGPSTRPRPPRAPAGESPERPRPAPRGAARRPPPSRGGGFGPRKPRRA